MDPVIVVFGFGIGLLIGMTGMGGASLMTPLLILVFGIQPVTAVGTDIFYGGGHQDGRRLAAPASTTPSTAGSPSGWRSAASRWRSPACG